MSNKAAPERLVDGSGDIWIKAKVDSGDGEARYKCDKVRGGTHLVRLEDIEKSFGIRR